MIIVGIDTYITLSEAADILGGSAYFESWNALSVEQQESALRSAAMHIDMLPLAGTKLSTEQTLEFPRKPYNTVPQQVKIAQAFEAAEIADSEKYERISLQAQGVTSITLGSISESYNGNIKGGSMMSIEAYRLMRKYIIGSAVIV